MATQADLRQRVRNYLYSFTPGQNMQTHTLGAAYTADGASMTVADGDIFSPGAVLEFEDGDLYKVTAVADDVLTVIPNWAVSYTHLTLPTN